MADLYTTKTAALKATKADVSKLNTKSLKVNGKDVATSVKHPNDTREVVTENDLWGSWAEITSDGEIIFHEDEVTKPDASNPSSWNMEITKVENNKAYVGDTLFGNIQTEKIKNGYNMFANCANLTTFNTDLSSLTDGGSMFYICSKLTTFSSDLSSLTSGLYMFYRCLKLTTFTSDLSSLTDGSWMFQNCTNLTTFNTDLSSLTRGYDMFENCSNLTTFTSDLSSLTDGSWMFYICSKLTTFTSDLSSLTNGYQMFSGCKLDTESLIHIAETINTVTNKPSIYIGIGNTTPTAEETELLTEIHNKGWQVYVNGTSSGNIFNPTATTPIDGEESITPIPFYAKPVESDEEHAEYIGEDGKFYIILGGNYIFVDDPETYGLFTSLEDAAANMRLTKIEKSEIKKA